MPLTLTVAAIVNRSGSVLIPAGSQVIGQLQPANGGSQFVANWLYTRVDATSRVINQTQVRRGANTGSRKVGAAAAAALEGSRGTVRSELETS